MKRIPIITHSLFYIFMIVSVITGYFKDFFFIMLLITIHEFGHIITSRIFKWNIEKVIILPFGGLTIFKEDINRPLKEELLITIMGPLMQVIGYLFLRNWIIDQSFTYYHYFILYFNLLPIIPLDGSKLINIFNNYIYSFWKSQNITLIISFITLLLLYFFCIRLNFNIILYLILFFLLVEGFKEYRRKKFVFNRFLLERYQKHYHFKKRILVYHGLEKEMRRDFNHLFYIKEKWYTEREFLARMFDFTNKLW